MKDPLNRPGKDLKLELKSLGVSVDDYIRALKSRWGSSWKSHLPGVVKRNDGKWQIGA